MTMFDPVPWSGPPLGPWSDIMVNTRDDHGLPWLTMKYHGTMVKLTQGERRRGMAKEDKILLYPISDHIYSLYSQYKSVLSTTPTLFYSNGYIGKYNIIVRAHQ